jgi:pyruvate/2-oxoglutarate dehydrogenase complex dihydrolipoamide dehydrogenase (E3) component
MKEFEHIIIGTGQATGTLLSRLITTGDKIAVIEGYKVGGSCVNYGCTPTKTLVASAKAIYKAKQGDFYGFETGKIKLNYSRIKERMNEIRNGSSNGLRNWIESSENVTFINEMASFVSNKTLKVGTENVKGNKIYINTGATPFVPPIRGINEVEWLDSEGLLDLEHLPKHLIIIGGGYIGMEYSQIYRRFGAKVTVIQRNEQVMPREDKDVADEIQAFLEEEGVKIYCNSNAKSVLQEDGFIKLEIEYNNQLKTITGSHLLIATGRKPAIDQLKLKSAGINTDTKGYIEVNNYCQTNVDNVYALGDVNGKGAFTHTSVNDAEIVIDHLFGGTRKISDRIPIYGLFTDPPMGKIGMSENEALRKGHKILKAKLPMKKISRAKEMGETKGFAKIIVDAETDLFLGITILGSGGDEIINMFAAIMYSRIPCHQYRKVVLVHPTVSELMPWALDELKPGGL